MYVPKGWHICFFYLMLFYERWRFCNFMIDDTQSRLIIFSWYRNMIKKDGCKNATVFLPNEIFCTMLACKYNLSDLVRFLYQGIFIIVVYSFLFWWSCHSFESVSSIRYIHWFSKYVSKIELCLNRLNIATMVFIPCMKITSKLYTK